jgi:hypothetical protein
MIIGRGTRLVGKTDVVPGLCYVRTQFGHFLWIPIIPLQTFVILHGSEGDGEFQGKPISMSFKSVLFGWLRTGAIFAGLIGIVLLALGAIGYLNEQEMEALGSTIFGVVMVAGAVLVYWMCGHFSRASRQRGYQLAKELGLPPYVIDQLINGQTLPLEDVQDLQLADDNESHGMPTPRRTLGG